jgi:hypothetical protein
MRGDEKKRYDILVEGDSGKLFLVEAKKWSRAYKYYLSEETRRAKENALIEAIERQESEISRNREARLSSREKSLPKAAERLLSCLLTPDRLEEAIGDFEDGFALMVSRHGIGHARRWYWWQIIAVALRGGFEAALRAAKMWFGPA